VSDLGITHSGAIDDDWHERYDPGYIAGGADAMAERILKAPQGRDAPDPNRPSPRRRRGSDLPQGFGDAAAREGYDARTGS
jgi:hypothetical protein